ncbi:flagellar biosynthesis repressor FlbT [Helicobacter cetorum]|uniref:Periplasmic protein n=1 Tax=Helicobacter cetorum (strain ATCC BAA-540 / CCUG 52418 / MIT 99-5656) TaxID=1163745 RepID=I0ESB3_HELCM|nr:flagellar biosynthesis repressor FlbT [Helicobacter cetorum]AFI05832.1 hypothetical protein HCD_04090 [Helicobacter cetorum MIT 99-5656]
MKILKTLSLYAFLFLGLLSHSANAEKMRDIANYPHWLKLNLFELDNPRNQYVGSALINDDRHDFYASFISHDNKLPPVKNAERIALVRAKLNAYSSLEAILIAKRMREHIYAILEPKDRNINSLFKIVNFLVSKSILAKEFVDTANRRVYIMVQFPFVAPEELGAYFKGQDIELSFSTAKAVSVMLNKTLFNI